MLGGCSTPISALAEINNDHLHFRGNIFSVDGKEKVEIEKITEVVLATHLGIDAAKALLNSGGKEIAEKIRNAGI